MKKTLSIIITCYNSASTLKESVDSVYTQGLEDFEVIMVDDGSADKTRTIMERLALAHPEIKLFFHSRNRGGGAARNTAIKNSTGEMIFCLDSDDILPPNMLPKLISFQQARPELDGVLFESAKFFEKNTRKTKDRLTLNAEGPTFENIFLPQTGSSTINNFLYTRKSYETVGGYPENHGFDTQEFGVIFLAKGLRAEVCKNTFYYHRRAHANKSYFERVYESGALSLNYYLIFEKILYLFSGQTRREILNYEVFNKTEIKSENLHLYLNRLYQKNPDGFFIENKDRYLNPKGWDLYLEDYGNSREIGDLYCLAVRAFQENDCQKSIRLYTEMLEKQFESPLVYFNIFRSLTCLNQNNQKSEAEKKTQEILKMISLEKPPELYNRSKLAKLYSFAGGIYYHLLQWLGLRSKN